MGHKHSRDEVIAAAVDVALADGLAGLTYRRVADRLGISDRMVVYYLPSKTDLVNATVGELSLRLQALLARAFGDSRKSPDELLADAWPVLAETAEADRVFGLFLELVGLAASRVEPFDSLATSIMTAWADWLADRVKGSTPEARRRQALGVMARVDGLLLVRHTLGARAADDAARALGLRR